MSTLVRLFLQSVRKINRINLQQISNVISRLSKCIVITEVINDQIISIIENKNINLQKLKRKVSKLLDYWELPNRYILAKDIPKLDNGKIDTKTILKNIK